MNKENNEQGEGLVTGYYTDYLFHQDAMDEELPDDVGFLVDLANNEVTINGKKMPYDLYNKLITGKME